MRLLTHGAAVRRRGWVLVLAPAALILVLVGVAACSPSDSGTGDGWRVADLGAARPGRQPAILGGVPAVIWQPLALANGLLFQPLESGPLAPILNYPDVHPSEWHAVPAPRGYHIVWREKDGRVRSALVSYAGETLRGPITLEEDAGAGIAVAGLPDGSALVIWEQPETHLLTSVRLDAEGRPGGPSRPLYAPVGSFVIAADRAGRVHAAWMTTTVANEWLLHYGVSDAAQPHFESTDSLVTLTLQRGEWLEDVALGLGDETAYLFWSIADAIRPNASRVFWMSLPLTGEAPSPPRELDTAALQAVASAPPPRLAAAPNLRWLTPAAGQADALSVALAVRTIEGWRAAVAALRGGNLVSFDIVSNDAAGAGPPSLARVGDGNPLVAWSGLDGASAHLYVASPNPPHVTP